jgi:hypothetical protein
MDTLNIILISYVGGWFITLLMVRTIFKIVEKFQKIVDK